ncbi:hypothetical protein ABZ725_08070 [Streptomyces sp. NPDC006872]|uniref:hypothetical protein n=1 Tax=Streptomyces sp. NPDC006872 TaxID=3155720 RepID=UPI00340AF30D
MAHLVGSVAVHRGVPQQQFVGPRDAGAKRLSLFAHDVASLHGIGGSARRADGVEGETCLLGTQDDGDAGEVRTAVFTGPTMLPLLTGLAEAACSTGAVTGEQTAGWIAEQLERTEADRLFLALPMF